MSKQRESLLILDPMTEHFKSQECYVKNLHGNKFQKGLPDLYVAKKGFLDRWVECKVIEQDGSIKFTPAQMENFPKMIAAGSRIYVICTPYNKPLRNDYLSRKRLYEKVFNEEPNGKFMTLGKAFYYLLY